VNHEGWTLQLEFVRCGQAQCKSCPHGPYWYGYRRAGKRLQKHYFGRRRPGVTAAGEEPGVKEIPPDAPHPHDAINCRATATLQLALEILGLPARCRDVVRIRARFLELCRSGHPDKGGDAQTFGRVHTAYSFTVSALGRPG
jgi:hypothetical protein